MKRQIRWAANLSLMFTELNIWDRPAAARDAGFSEVEFWWPFGVDSTPGRGEIESFISSIEDAGVHLLAMNLYGGDMAAGERGVLSYNSETKEFQDSVGIAMDIGGQLNTKLFNAPYGFRRHGLDHIEQDRVGEKNLAFAAKEVQPIGGTIMLEPLSMPDYPMSTVADGIKIIDRVQQATGVDNLGILFDQYHLALSGDDLDLAVESFGDRISHVQLADIPGRGEPGSGQFDLKHTVDSLLDIGYRGCFALEYIPTTTTLDSLDYWRQEVSAW